ncbi:hypothetical protein F5148DRAFT_1240675 [Russula earlei]|uniref:Uncharacterized protein n=1 Tax=Russula earlei TaxID=71964 RepID=A0ACC0TVS2_9AGAM|nr:hypothetical protein F5148DRAFT_1240675 [Russula earlei]
MEYIFPSKYLYTSPNRARFCDKWIQDLWNLMESFHNHGFVHGDLRGPNMVFEDAQYPTGRLSTAVTVGRPEDAIDDDRRVSRNTLDMLK